jgi:transcriptional regulator with XRE-family HTH domain
MLRNNLKTAIGNSGLIVKEIAHKSKVNKRTIDKWVGASETEPKVKDLYKVCIVLNVTMEEIVAGKKGSEFVKKVIKNDPSAIQVPERIFPIVERLLLLDARDLGVVWASVEALSSDKKGQLSRTDTEVMETAG